MSQEIENLELEEGSNAVTKGAAAAETSQLKDESEEIGGPTPTSGKPDDTESIGKKVAAKVSKMTGPSNKPSAASGDTQDSLKKSPTFEETEEDNYQIVHSLPRGSGSGDAERPPALSLGSSRSCCETGSLVFLGSARAAGGTAAARSPQPLPPRHRSLVLTGGSCIRPCSQPWRPAREAQTYR